MSSKGDSTPPAFTLGKKMVWLKTAMCSPHIKVSFRCDYRKPGDATKTHTLNTGWRFCFLPSDSLWLPLNLKSRQNLPCVSFSKSPMENCNIYKNTGWCERFIQSLRLTADTWEGSLSLVFLPYNKLVRMLQHYPSSGIHVTQVNGLNDSTSRHRLPRSLDLQ